MECEGCGCEMADWGYKTDGLIFHSYACFDKWLWTDDD